MNRRLFLRTTALGTTGLVILRDAASAQGTKANDKLALAHIGCGGRGAELLGGFSSQERTVALCDVNESRAEKMLRMFPDLPKFQDYRVMIEKMGKEIDAVVVATPDHSHAPASALAIRAGKHVYTEKPLTRTVYESRTLRKLAREFKVATSMGNQGTASGQFRRALELIREGTLPRPRRTLRRRQRDASRPSRCRDRAWTWRAFPPGRGAAADEPSARHQEARVNSMRGSYLLPPRR